MHSASWVSIAVGLQCSKRLKKVIKCIFGERKIIFCQNFWHFVWTTAEKDIIRFPNWFLETKTSRLTPRCFCWPICSFGMSALSKHSLKERKSYMVLICTFRDCEFLFRVEPFVLVGMNKSGNSQTAPAPKNAELCIMALSQPQKEKKAKRQWQMQ